MSKKRTKQLRYVAKIYQVPYRTVKKQFKKGRLEEYLEEILS